MMRSIIRNGSDELPPNEVRGHYLILRLPARPSQGYAADRKSKQTGARKSKKTTEREGKWNVWSNLRRHDWSSL